MFPGLAGAKIAAETLYVEDVFSAFTYTGTGASLGIVNGVDLSTKGGLVWFKQRSQASTDHVLYDSARGPTKELITNATSAESTQANGLTAFNSDGFSVGSRNMANQNGQSLVSWTFRKAAKFFDVVTYTGTGVARTIAHSLGVTPGMIIVKRTDNTGSWFVWHRSLGDFYLFLQSTSPSAAAGADVWNDTAPTSTEFSVGTNANLNANGGTYVAYLFAHDTASDGIIQCGTWTGSGQTVTLGWEPQYILYKQSSGTDPWVVLDTSRTWNLGATEQYLAPNSSAAQTGITGGNPTATGFISGGSAGTHVYVAIRKGLMRPPTDATKVFAINARTGTGATATVTAGSITTGPDLVVAKERAVVRNVLWQDRLRGIASQLYSSTTLAEGTASDSVTAFNMDSVSVGSDGNAGINANSFAYINYFLKQARGFFDIVAYNGTGSAKTEAHNLGVVPELIIVKGRTPAGTVEADWCVYYGTATKNLRLNTTAAEATASNVWNNTAPTNAVFSLGGGSDVNRSSCTFIAYLFASLPGVSKIGTYTGNATTNQINCGFAAGARFVLIKRIDSTGDWYFWDTTRGIVSGNDPYLLMNSLAVEVTSTDYIDPYSAGFELSSTAPAAINANGGTFLYLAIA